MHVNRSGSKHRSGVKAALLLALSTCATLVARPCAVSAAPDTTREEPAATIRLDVPYVPQTEALCGGAAAAMVFRFWGDRHADPQAFAPLVDRRAGGIATDALLAAVQQRGWPAAVLSGSLETIRTALSERRPLVLLIEDRPSRYHYIVVVGMSNKVVFANDPSWGPSRAFAIDDLVRRWASANFWAMRIEPLPQSGAQTRVQPIQDGSPRMTAPDQSAVPGERRAPAAVQSSCDRMTNEVVETIDGKDFEKAETALELVRRRCPQAARPVSELAGVRFAQHRWPEAESTAREALVIDDSDRYAWDVLGSSRFVRDNQLGALDAWNRIDKPRVDTVVIAGLSHTRYALVAERLGLRPNTVLTRDDLERARHRLRELPSNVGTRIDYRPSEDGFADVEVAMFERAAVPRGGAEWLAHGVRTLVDREVRTSIPGSGQGETWTGAWRWWEERPSVAFSFAAPKIGRLGGIWRVGALWESQRFATANAGRIEEARTHGAVSVSDWLTGTLRYEIQIGVDRWNDSRHDASIGAALERRWLEDRVSLSARSTRGTPMGGGASYGLAGFHAALRSSPLPRGLVVRAIADVEAASAATPLSLWPGAGNDDARAPLSRAHPLLHGGVVDGPIFGRRLSTLTFETERWMERLQNRVGLAGFLDVARAWDRLRSGGDGWQADVGAGFRFRLPGTADTLRLDVARGLRDRRQAISVGFSTQAGQISR